MLTLLEAGANPNDSDDYSTALITSLANESYDLAKILYSYGANPKKLIPLEIRHRDFLGVNTVYEFEIFLEEPYYRIKAKSAN